MISLSREPDKRTHDETAKRLSTRTVVVSGASSGIGRAVAQRLAGDGFAVLAGVRSATAADDLAKLGDSIRPVILDVTDPDHIDAVAKECETDGLFAVVNNAGTALRGPLEFLDIDRVRHQFEVNLFGHLALTQALLPALRRSRGRIVNMGSVSGRVAFPFYGAYAGSKFALEAFSDALRRELAPSGIAVSLVEPGNTRTAIWDKTFHAEVDAAQAFPPEAWQYYREPKAPRRSDHFPGPEVVAAAVSKALAAKRPRARYPVGRDARFYSLASRLLPDSLLDRIV